MSFLRFWSKATAPTVIDGIPDSMKKVVMHDDKGNRVAFIVSDELRRIASQESVYLVDIYEQIQKDNPHLPHDYNCDLVRSAALYIDRVIEGQVGHGTLNKPVGGGMGG